MSTLKLHNSKPIGDNCPPYIIAEINTSHFGNIDIAKEMVVKAKEIGCDCVKFQSWSSETLYSKTFYEKNPIAKRMVKKLAFSEAELYAIYQHCQEVGIDFSSTPYSKDEVDFLADKCQVPFIKIASMELNNYPFLEYIAKKEMPIILSTGMGSINEIEKAVNVIEKAGNTNLCLLHCISIYPPEISTIRLKNILGLQKKFPNYVIGFSDHSLGIEMPTAAIALGASLIEKHFTLDKSRIGMDNQMALEPDEMKNMIENCHNVFQALGDTERIVTNDEIEQSKKMRRSLIASRDLSAGTTLTINDIDAKRPGTGISPDRLNDIIGKTLVKDVEKDTLFSETDFQ